jgi:putative toxin-antitoxin system antitoxin component (TIGR02293 family)
MNIEARSKPSKPKAAAKKVRAKASKTRAAKAKRKTESKNATTDTRRPYTQLAVKHVTVKGTSKRHPASNIEAQAFTTEEQRIVNVIELKPGHGVKSIESLVKQGLPYSTFKTMEGKLHITQNQLADFLSIPNTTLARRRREKRLNTEESDRLIRYARMLTLARDMMEGDEEAANRWLTDRHLLLNDESPLEHAVTEVGARDVEDLITRVQFGVYS